MGIRVVTHELSMPRESSLGARGCVSGAAVTRVSYQAWSSVLDVKSGLFLPETRPPLWMRAFTEDE